MKAIIALGHKGSIFGAINQQIVNSRQGQSPNYHLSFESARSLFAELTPARLDLLDTLRRIGSSSIYSLAKMPIAITQTFIPTCRGYWNWV